MYCFKVFCWSFAICSFVVGHGVAQDVREHDPQSMRRIDGGALQVRRSLGPRMPFGSSSLCLPPAGSPEWKTGSPFDRARTSKVRRRLSLGPSAVAFQAGNVMPLAVAGHNLGIEGRVRIEPDCRDTGGTLASVSEKLLAGAQ